MSFSGYVWMLKTQVVVVGGTPYRRGSGHRIIGSLPG